MSRLSIGRRLGVSLSVILAILAAVVVIGVVNLQAARDASGALGSRLNLTRDAMQAKFRTADFAGWQTGYALDATRGVAGATDDTVGQRKEFLASTTAFRLDLDRIARYELTADETADLAAVQEAFEAFLAVDQRIIANFRVGTPRAADAANALASGESLELFGQIAGGVDDLVASVRTRSDAAAAGAHAQAEAAERTLLVAGLFGLALTVGLGIVLTRSLTRPLAALTARLAEIADGDGDLTQRADEDRRDELGALAAAFNRFTAKMAGAVGIIAGHADRLGSSAQQLAGSGDAMAANAESTSTQAGAASAAAEQVSRSVQSVATAAEEMTASIQEIAHNAGEAATVAERAVQVAADTSATIAKLGDSSAEIGDVVKAITSIAAQTNLLALNATIEAARAGDAGKGFAVVANEVKELAQETAKATEDIAQRVDAIQRDTGGAVAAIEEIESIIGRISDFQTTIASAVEEQTATTNQMSRSVGEAATGTTQIAGNITLLADAAQSTAGSLAEGAQAIAEMGRMSGDLQDVVGQFRY